MSSKINETMMPVFNGVFVFELTCSSYSSSTSFTILTESNPYSLPVILLSSFIFLLTSSNNCYCLILLTVSYAGLAKRTMVVKKKISKENLKLCI